LTILTILRTEKRLSRASFNDPEKRLEAPGGRAAAAPFEEPCFPRGRGKQGGRPRRPGGLLKEGGGGGREASRPRYVLRRRRPGGL